MFSLLGKEFLQWLKGDKESTKNIMEFKSEDSEHNIGLSYYSVHTNHLSSICVLLLGKNYKL